jgi:urea transporter
MFPTFTNMPIIGLAMFLACVVGFRAFGWVGLVAGFALVWLVAASIEFRRARRAERARIEFVADQLKNRAQFTKRG